MRAELAAARSNGRPNPASSDPAGAVCFDEATDYEITVEGRKVIGSAQTRRGGGLLQQGSVLLQVDLDHWAHAFRFADAADRLKAQTRLAVRMAGLDEFAPTPLYLQPGGRGADRRAGRGPGRASGPRLDSRPPKKRGAADLRAEKYATKTWTFRK